MLLSPCPCTSSFLGPNTLLNTQFSNALSLRSAHNVSYHVSHPHKTTGKNVFVYSHFIFLSSELEDKRFCTDCQQTFCTDCQQTFCTDCQQTFCTDCQQTFPEFQARNFHELSHSQILELHHSPKNIINCLNVTRSSSAN